MREVPVYAPCHLTPPPPRVVQKLPAEDLRKRVLLSINQMLAALPLYPCAVRVCTAHLDYQLEKSPVNPSEIGR